MTKNKDALTIGNKEALLKAVREDNNFCYKKYNKLTLINKTYYDLLRRDFKLTMEEIFNGR